MLAWHKKWVRPYESMWCIVTRFCYLNQPEMNELNGLLYGGYFSSRRSSRDGTRLSGEDALSHDKPQRRRVLEAPARSIPSRYSNYYKLDLFTREEPRLKYCPDCMTIFFHSAIHQATALKYCPIHHTLLVDECQRCGCPIYPEIEIRKKPDLIGYCKCAGFPRELGRMTDMFKPLPPAWKRSLKRFSRMARKVAADSRHELWLFDSIIHEKGDRTAYGLFASAIGLPQSYCKLFHLVPVRRRHRNVISPEDPRHPDSAAEWRVTDPALYLHKRARDEIAARLAKYYERVAFDGYVRDPASAPSPWLRKGQLFRVKGPWMLSGSGVCSEAYRRWRYLWTRRRFVLLNNSHISGAIECLANDLVAHHHAEYEIRRIKEQPVHLTGSALRWAIRKMTFAMLVHSYAWIAAWCQALDSGKMDIPDSRFDGVGIWCLPRIYYLPDLSGDGSCAMYITSPDVNSRNFEELLMWDSDYGELANVEQLKNIFGGDTPPPLTTPGLNVPNWSEGYSVDKRPRGEWVPNQLLFDLPSKNAEQLIPWQD